VQDGLSCVGKQAGISGGFSRRGAGLARQFVVFGVPKATLPFQDNGCATGAKRLAAVSRTRPSTLLGQWTEPLRSCNSSSPARPAIGQSLAGDDGTVDPRTGSSVNAIGAVSGNRSPARRLS
jgi:hypothetical protein